MEEESFRVVTGSRCGRIEIIVNRSDDRSARNYLGFPESIVSGSTLTLIGRSSILGVLENLILRNSSITEVLWWVTIFSFEVLFH